MYEFSSGFQDSFIEWFRFMCAEEAVYSRKHGDFERANVFNAMSETYDGTQGSAWYDFNTMGKVEECTTSNT